MRRAELYMEGLYAGILHRTHVPGGQLRHSRRYRQRKKKQREGLWRHTAGKCAAVLLLGTILGTAVKTAADAKLLIPKEASLEVSEAAETRLEMAEPAKASLEMSEPAEVRLEVAETAEARGEEGAAYPEYAAGNRVKAREAASGSDLPVPSKIMYLTFDDGPSPENTAAVLDVLKERNIKATFFVIGENVRNYPEMARRIVEEGHTIGIHCDWHEYKTLYRSVDSYVADFEKAYETVKEVTGVEAKLFRFPGGSINSYNRTVYKGIIEEMTNRGFVYFDWNASLEDAVKKANPDTLIENAVSSALNRKRVVMLAHDVVYQTGQCLDELIGQFPEYRMEPLTEDVAPVQF